ncbi:hypothetical protein K0U07_01865 [bacterium]|nr:hypothetical protein [bacterium]
MTQNEKRVLILTVSGGGGHLQAARAKYLELCEEKNTTIIQRDVFLDYLGKFVGTSFAETWNYCQAHGKITFLYLFSICMYYVDKVISPLLMIRFFFTLTRNNITHVIDTQHEGTKAFLRVVRFLSKWRKKKIHYEKVLTDLPTKKCNHYFRPFRNLSGKYKEYLTVCTTKPLLEAGETEESFWKKYTGLSIENIHYTGFPLRPTFTGLTKQEDLSLTFNTYSAEHTHAVCKAISFGSSPFRRQKNSIAWKHEGETLSLITLGSYPQKSLMVKYMLEFIKQKNIHNRDRKDVLFLLVGPEETALDYFHSIIKEIENTSDYPKSLTVVPLAFQHDTALAPLYASLDFIIAKAGGLTTMELIKAVDGSIFIHDTPEQGLSRFFTKLTKHKHDAMLPWERGNANYIIAKKKAQIITPELFETVTKDFFAKSTNASLVNA